VLSQAEILVSRDHARQRRQEWSAMLGVRSGHLRRGYVALGNILPPFHLGALRRYYRALVQLNSLTLGDSQVQRWVPRPQRADRRLYPSGACSRPRRNSEHQAETVLFICRSLSERSGVASPYRPQPMRLQRHLVHRRDAGTARAIAMADISRHQHQSGRRLGNISEKACSIAGGSCGTTGIGSQPVKP
jgi:hypothetical protein